MPYVISISERYLENPYYAMDKTGLWSKIGDGKTGTRIYGIMHYIS